MEAKFTVYDSQGELDLRQIADSGQCFRLKEYDTDKFVAVTGFHAVDIHHRGDVHIFWCHPEEFQTIWVPYFDLETDYKAFKAQMQGDPFLREALEICALYPLGRFYDFQDNSFYYFVNPVTCQPNRKDGKEWTLQEWLDEFKIEETEKMARAWNRLIGGLTMVTHKMSRDKIQGRFLDVLLAVLYLDYDTDKPYIEQVEQHMTMLTDVFKNEFGKVLKFDPA